MKATFYIVVVISFWFLASHIDYTVAKEIADEKKEVKPTQYAPIRPLRCDQFAAGQADGGKWKILYCKRGTRA